jgi:hypothetical protein
MSVRSLFAVCRRRSQSRAAVRIFYSLGCAPFISQNFLIHQVFVYTYLKYTLVRKRIHVCVRSFEPHAAINATLQ